MNLGTKSASPPTAQMDPENKIRRTVSVRGSTYDRLRDYSTAQGMSMSDVVERELAKVLPPVPTIEQSRRGRKFAQQPPPAASVRDTPPQGTLRSRTTKDLSDRRATIAARAPSSTAAKQSAPAKIAAPMEAAEFSPQQIAASIGALLTSVRSTLYLLRQRGFACVNRRGVWQATPRRGAPPLSQKLANKILNFMRTAPAMGPVPTATHRPHGSNFGTIPALMPRHKAQGMQLPERTEIATPVKSAAGSEVGRPKSRTVPTVRPKSDTQVFF